MTPDGWDDPRLTAAFLTMASATTTPADLQNRTVSAVRASIRNRDSQSSGWRRLWPAGASVAAVGIMLAVFIAVGGPSRVGPPGTAMPSASGIADASAPAGAQTMGLGILTVEQAISVRDVGADDREIAVRGWYAAHAPERACGRLMVPEPVSPLQVRCPDQLLWLTHDREQLTTMTATSTSYRGPTGPAISPHFDDVDMAWSAPLDDPFRPAELVVIGHFDDSGAGRCPAADHAACADRFVVDRIDSIDGVEQPVSVVDRVDGAELSTPDDIHAVVEREAPSRPILSMVVVDARLEGLADGPSSTVWVARVLGQRVVEEHVVFDGTDEVVMWPPDGATIVELPIDIGSGRPPVRVAVIDQTRHLVDARAATASETASRDLSMRAVWADDLPDGRVLVQWGGSMCDDRLTLTISAFDAGTPFTLTVDGRRGSPCRLALVYYAIVLEFEPAIGAADVGGRYLIGP